jgi:AbrB family looped-hinge helix DNA binding protein
MDWVVRDGEQRGKSRAVPQMKIGSRGQIVIPQGVRDHCELRKGDRFVVEADPETQAVTLRKIKDRGNWFDV